ncbi:hypothetical protein HYU11_04110 [Candidatus Woesearchaeota archaeon]|nr:hypothetical protein [Candidatus Woesearchaeota archaeon]
MSDKSIIFSPLELLVVNNAWGKGDFFIRARKAARQGVELQKTVFEEKGVSFPEKRVLQYKDSVGERKEPGALDGTSNYHHMYLLHNGTVIGMRATEQTDIKGVGPVILDYIPPLVPEGLVRKSGYNVLDLLDLNQWVTVTPLSGIVAKFTDGIGLSRDQLRDLGYLRSDARISVPTLDANTREEYMAVIDKVPMYAKPMGQNDDLRLTKTGDESLLVANYLKQGYLDNTQLRKLGLKINDLPCVVETRASIADAVKSQGYVAFRPF